MLLTNIVFCCFVHLFFSKGIKTVLNTYGSLENVSIVTLAPEKKNSFEVIKALTEKNITVAVGHSTANLTVGEEATKHGSNLITHLFNAMLPVMIKYIKVSYLNIFKVFIMFFSFTIATLA